MKIFVEGYAVEFTAIVSPSKVVRGGDIVIVLVSAK